MSVDYGPSGAALGFPYTPAQGGGGGAVALAGDVTGTSAASVVSELQGEVLTITGPLAAGEVLASDAGGTALINVDIATVLGVDPAGNLTALGIPDPTGAPDGQVVTTTGGVYGLAAPASRSPVPPACVARWLLDDTGSTIVDSVGAYDLSYSGAAGQQSRPSPWGRCLYTGGLAAGAGPKGAAALEPAAVSVAVWANMFAYATPSQYLVGKRQDDANWSGASPTNMGFGLYCQTDGRPGAYAYCASGNPAVGPSGLESRLPLDTWCRVVATYDTTDGLRLYVDGQLAGSAAALGAIVWGSGSWTLGVNNSGSGVVFPQVFNGFIRDVCICDRVLTAAEILRDYQQGIGYAP